MKFALPDHSATSGNRERLLIFTRFPQPGRTKTRLIPALGRRGAAFFQRWMTERIVQRARRFASVRSVSIEIWYSGAGKGRLRAWLGSDLSYFRQSGGDIGRRMKVALADTFRRGAHRAVLIGSDIPGLGPNALTWAFDRIAPGRLILNPTRDQGYCLIGLQADSFQHRADVLFGGIDWGTRTVLPDTLQAARSVNLAPVLAEPLEDIDRPDTLRRWFASDFCKLSPEAVRTSVVIPTLNEARLLDTTLSALHPVGSIEVIVADAGSLDGTAVLAQAMGIRVHRGHPPRSVQMNAGAAMASGDLLIFLHADTRLPRGFDLLAHCALCGQKAAGGAFELGISAPDRSLHWIAAAANLRSRYLHLPYGDQAIFLLRNTFESLGGFKPMAIMEDYDLMRRLRRRGRIVTVPVPVSTSARRWENLGIFKTWLLNQIALGAFHAGVAPNTIARWYRRQKGIGGG